MPQSIEINEPAAGNQYIVVNNDVIEIKSDTVDITNNLGGDAQVTFYRNGRTKLADNPINEFCDSFEGAFPVAAGETSTCNVRNGINDREYLYKVEAVGYQPLDPVMILDRKGGGFGEGFSLLTVAIVTAVGGAVGFTAGHQLAMRKRSREAS